MLFVWIINLSAGQVPATIAPQTTSTFAAVVTVNCATIGAAGAVRTSTNAVTLWAALGTAPSLALAIVEFGYLATTSISGYTIGKSAVTTTGFTLTVTVQSAFRITALKVKYLASVLPQLLLFQSTISSGLGTLTSNSPANRLVHLTVPFPSALELGMTILALDNGLAVSSSSGSSYGLLYITTMKTATSLNFTLSVMASQSTTVSTMTVGFIAFSKPVLQSKGYNVLSGAISLSNVASNFQLLINAKSSTINSNVVGLSNYLNLNTHDMDLTIAAQSYSATINVNYTDATTVNNHAFSFAYVALVTVTCPVAPNLYLDLTRITCQAACPSGTYLSGSICLVCHYSCLTCSGLLSTQCLSCGNNRVPAGAFPGSCTCLPYYFQAQVTACQACPYYCASCTSIASCTTCDTTWNRQNTLPNCPCIANAFDLAVNICAICHQSCVTCTNPSSASSCLTCPAASNRAGTPVYGWCNCTAGFFDAGVAVCAACLAPCASCTDATNNGCTSCVTNDNRQLQGTSCVCKTSFFLNTTNQCQACHFSCLNCSGSTVNECLNCSLAWRRYLVGTTCPCIVSAYQNNVQICPNCNVTCLTCIAASGTSCTSCSHTNRRYFLVNACPCITGWFSTGVAACNLCSYKCENCTTAATTCTSCVPNTMRTFLTSACNCIPGTYDDGSSIVCKICFSLCATCNGPNSNQCISCFTARKFTLSGGSCICSPGFFFISNECSFCHYSCLTCTSGSANSCSGCDGTWQRTASGTSCPCNPGYLDVFVSKCSPCSVSCATCSQKFWNCTSCITGQNRQLIGSSCVCLTGKYQTGPGVCPSCNTKCLTCSVFASNCLTCDVLMRRGLDQPSSFCTCNPGYYDSGPVLCSTCFSTCLTCSGPANNNCLSCILTRRLSALFTCDCLSSAYAISATACSNCHSSCQTCSGGSNNQCVTCFNYKYMSPLTNATGTFCVCNPGLYMAASCLTCPYFCGTCPSNLVCTSCPSNSYRSLPASNCPCNVGYFDSVNVVCSQCHYSCATCVNLATNCLTCSPTRMQVGSTCPCSSGTYDNGYNLCQACSQVCLTCMPTAISCTSCNSALNRLQSGTNCVCRAGYYESNPCQLCIWPCSTCLGPSSLSCLSCVLGANLQLSFYVCSCIPSFFSNAAVCSPCDTSCSTCFAAGPSSCLSCNYPRRLIGNTCSMLFNCPSGLFAYKLSCVTLCPSDTFPQTGLCKDCPFSCLICVSMSNCSSCTATYYLQLATCVSSCSSAYYFSGASCLPCGVHCLTCNSIFCLVCTAGMLYSGSTCASSCPSGSFSLLSTCNACPTLCTSCTSISTCTSCIPGFSLFGSVCGNCPAGTVQKAGQCKNCQQNCLRCTATACLACMGQSYLSGSVCAPFGKYQSAQGLSNCFTTCLQCSGPLNHDCIRCIPDSGNLGLPVEGACPCTVGTLTTYVGICDRNATSAILFRTVSTTSLFASTVFLGASALLTGSSSLVDRLLSGNQELGAHTGFSSQSAMGLQVLLGHYSMYGLRIISPNWLATNLSSYSFRRILAIAHKNQPVANLAITAVVILSVAWVVVLIAFIAKSCAYWRGTVLDSDQDRASLDSLFDQVCPQIPLRTFSFAALDLSTAIVLLLKGGQDEKFLGSICTVLLVGHLTFYSVQGCRACTRHSKPPKGYQFMFNDMQKSLLTVKSGAFNLVWLFKRIGVGICAGFFYGQPAALYAQLFLSALLFGYFLWFNAFGKADRILLYWVQITDMANSAGLLALVYSNSASIKTVISMALLGLVIVRSAAYFIYCGVKLFSQEEVSEEDEIEDAVPHSFIKIQQY